MQLRIISNNMERLRDTFEIYCDLVPSEPDADGWHVLTELL